jgi:hypothetical protein
LPIQEVSRIKSSSSQNISIFDMPLFDLFVGNNTMFGINIHSRLPIAYFYNKEEVFKDGVA